MSHQRGWYEGDEWKPADQRENDPLPPPLPRPPSPFQPPSARERMKTNWLLIEMAMVEHPLGGWYNPEFENAHNGDHRWPLLYIPQEWTRGLQSYRTFQRAVLLAFKRALRQS